MKYVLEQVDDKNEYRLWWKEKVGDKEYGKFILVTLPIDDLQKYLDVVKNSYELLLADNNAATLIEAVSK